ncbi:MAG: U32 family peptidase [Bacteroidetes bacterium]|nr:U32 family peptidase [Bacteroidota bacterium]
MGNTIEITAPVGSMESLAAAVQAGAGSIYFGMGKLNMRSRSSVNFTFDDLPKIMAICKKHSMKAYLALNTVIFDEEITEMRKTADEAKKHGVDAIIATDLAVMEYVRSIGMPVHISTQHSVSNYEAVKFFSQYADVIVLARELTLDQVKNIADRIREENLTGPSGNLVKLEMFVHGALCMAISGKCYLSLDNMGFSGNRGACLQLCRRSYIVTDKEEGFEFEVDNEYIMSPKDLNTIGFIDKILATGVSVLKIEGRGRPADYVKTVVQCYQEAVAAVEDGSFSPEKVTGWNARLATVFNRGFWDGYYMGAKLGEWDEKYGSRATVEKSYCAKVNNYFSKLGVAEIKMETGRIETGNKLMIIGPTTGVVEFELDEIRTDRIVVNSAEKGDVCSIPVPELVRRGDKLFLLKSRQA